jgi:hypothetical protein
MATEIVNILCQKSGDGRLPIFMLDHDQQNVLCFPMQGNQRKTIFLV